MEDEKIIELYWLRSESAITETDKKYREHCMYIARNILNDISDSEECLNDTYLAAWNSMPPERPIPSPDPVLPVNRENNGYDHAVLSEKTYSKRCVYVFTGDQLGEDTVLPFFIEDVSTGSGCRAVAKTVNEFSSDEIFLLKCGTTEGKFYVFLNDSLSDEEEEKIFETLGITELN